MVPKASDVIGNFSTKTRSTNVRTASPREHLFGGKFSRAARAIWPQKTAAHLAAAAHVSERAAEYWLAGEREPSAAALLALINGIAEGK